MARGILRPDQHRMTLTIYGQLCDECASLWPCQYELGRADEKRRARRIILEHYRVAPKAALPLLRDLGLEEETG